MFNLGYIFEYVFDNFMVIIIYYFLIKLKIINIEII